MMPVIRVSDTTYRLLQKYAVPFEDTQDSVINKMAAFYDHNHGDKPGVLPSHTNQEQTEQQTPDLRFTKVLDAHFNNVNVKNWNGLLKEALIQAWREVEDYNSLRRMTTANIAQGERSDSGYKYIPEIDISFQGIDSTNAWHLSKEIAQKLDVTLSVDFIWRDKRGAAHPGENEKLFWLSKITI
jgi:hypothetical protein